MKKIIITLTIIFSSFLFINKTSALTTDDGYNYVYFNYDYDFVSSSVKSAYFNNIISDIKTKFESSAYDKYIIYFDDNNYVHAMFGYSYIELQGYSSDSGNSTTFQFTTWEQRAVLTYSLSSGNLLSYTDFNKVSSNTVYTNIDNLYSINVNTNTNISDLNPYFAIYDSNCDIKTHSWSSRFYLFYDLNKNALIQHDENMPLAKNNLISIDYDVVNNTKVVNDKEYILSKDLTINYNVDDYTKYIYLYKKQSDDNWSTYNFTTDNTSFTLNVTENTSYIARIVDKSTNEEVYTSTMTVTGINYDEYINDNLNITFTSKNNIVNDKVASVNLTIDYGVIDNNKYIYLYKKLDDSNWTTVNLINNSYIDVLINKNNSIIAQILDKSTYEVVKQSTMTITNIDYDLSIDFNTEYLKDDFGNIYQTNVDIIFNSSNRDLFYYEYRKDNFILDNKEFWSRLDDDKSNIVVQNRDNIYLYARIIDKSNDETVYTTTYKITTVIDKPKISFKTFNNLSYKNGKNYITSVTLTIDFGLIDNSKYVYQYKKLNDDYWTTLNLFNNNTDIEITQNDSYIARVIELDSGEVVTSASITITNIYEGSYLETTNDFISTISRYISSFFNLFSYFFNGLNPYIRNCVVALFTIIIMCAIIKNLRK